MKKLDISKFTIWWIMLIVMLIWFASIILVQRYFENIFNENISIILMLIITVLIILFCFLASDINYYFRNASFFLSDSNKDTRFYIERVPYKHKKIESVKKKLLTFLEKKKLTDNIFEVNRTIYTAGNRLSKKINLKFLFGNQVADINTENQYVIKIVEGNIDNSDFENYKGVNCIICQEDEKIKVFLEIKTASIYDDISNMHVLRVLDKTLHKGDKILLIDEALFIYMIIENRIR